MLGFHSQNVLQILENMKLTIKVNNSGIQMPTDDGVQIIDYITIYANGNLDIELLDRQ